MVFTTTNTKNELKPWDCGHWKREETNDLFEVYKMIHGLSATSPSIFFEFLNKRTTRGQNQMFYKQASREDVRLHFLSNRVVNRRNHSPEEAVNATSIGMFKRRSSEIRNKKMGYFMDI